MICRNILEHKSFRIRIFRRKNRNYVFTRYRMSLGQFNHNFERNRNHKTECKVAESRRCLLLIAVKGLIMIVWHLARGGEVRGASRGRPLSCGRECDGALNREYPRGRDYLTCCVCDIKSRFLSRTLAHASRRNVRCVRIRDETTIDRGDTIVAQKRKRDRKKERESR